MSDVKTTPHPIFAAAKAALPYSAPMIAGFLFLGIAYGIYMKALGFGVWYPFLMALLIYGGSVEFIIAGALTLSFAPLNALLITLMVSGRQIFYSISMLEKYGKFLGKKRPYLIATLVDESFSLNYMAKIPPHLDRGWYLFGNIIPFNLKGIEFAMTALFLVIFTENWTKEKSHESSLLGLAIAFISLLIFGHDYFLLPTLIGIWMILTFRRPKLITKLERVQ